MITRETRIGFRMNKKQEKRIYIELNKHNIIYNQMIEKILGALEIGT